MNNISDSMQKDAVRSAEPAHPANAPLRRVEGTVPPELIARMTRNEADMAFKKRVQTVFEWVPPRDGMLILDMPCGRGFYLNMYRYVCDGVRMVGGDLDWEVMQKADRNIGHLPNLPLVNCNIYALPFPDNTFDAVLLSEVLEHVDDDVGAMREALRVLKPGGVAAITVPNADYPFWWDPINRTLEFLFKRPIRQGVLAGIWANHVRLYRRDLLRERVLQAGFLLEEERAFTHDSFPFIHNIVYGIGKPLLESGLLPDEAVRAADRTRFDHNDGSLLNPINFGVALFNWFDRKNVLNEAPGRATVNLAAKARKPE
ncbi:MAG: class I SAM-dependent methyltransferase [Anaerolineae bacterium]|nr:class I SAM-dependent methyltransferase [Anaerolineae bacterium]NUQ06149.1 class I SAM-dependent methyltransferase [Anaerolineae bacterium]